MGGTSSQIGDDVFKVASTMADRTSGMLAGEAAINVAAMSAGAVVDGVEQGQWTNPFTKENILANMVDPTIAFGVAELINPTLISQTRAVTDDNVQKRKRLTLLLKLRLLSLRLSILRLLLKLSWRSNVRVDFYNKQLDQITDPNDREIMRVKIQDAKAKAYENLTDYKPSQIETIFGQETATLLDSDSRAPVTESVLKDDGTSEEVEVKPMDVLLPVENEAGDVVASVEGAVSRLYRNAGCRISQ